MSAVFPDEFSSHSGRLRTRFAPSPTGYLHLGHVASALFVWGLARKYGAEIILRMEDHDQGRCRKAYETSILEDLDWLGLLADKGVRSSAEASAFRQSDHWQRYEEAVRILSPEVYHCSCSRKEILERTTLQKDELWYDGYCRTRDQGPSLRLNLETQIIAFNDLCLGPQTQIPAEQCGDLLLKDRDGYWTYNFAVVVDDRAEDINLIIRGEDLLTASGRQIQLREMLGERAQPWFYHHPLIWQGKTKKLSKRDGSTSLAHWRSQGYRPGELLGKAAFQIGLIAEERSLLATDIEGLF